MKKSYALFGFLAIILVAGTLSVLLLKLRKAGTAEVSAPDTPRKTGTTLTKVPRLALVKAGDKLGFIDNTGKYVVNPQFDAAESYMDELAGVKVADKWGFIDKT